MSGHDTYECELNRKPNLRAICINSMSDRAFNIYAEFYTHTLNICWFLRGQIWQETIAENTWKVGKQLQDSAKNQEEILKNQKESLELQERLLKYGNVLEENMEKFYKSSREQQEIINLFSLSLNNLQSWLLGELSWFDTLIFYIVSSLFVMFFTSVSRTNNARLLMLCILTSNTFIERLICYVMSRKFPDDIREVHNDYYIYIWISRYICIFINVVILILTAIFHKDVDLLNNKLLTNMHNKIISLSEKIDNIQSKNTKNDCTENNISYISEYTKSPENNVMKYLDSIKSSVQNEVNSKFNNTDTINQKLSSNKFENDSYNDSYTFKENSFFQGLSSRKKINTFRGVHENGYNLRRKTSKASNVPLISNS